MPTRDGIDVSHWQNEAGGGGPNAINWAAVRSAGAKYTFVKVSENTGTDGFARANLRKARQAGMLVGGYHFMRFSQSGIAQANAFLSNYEFQSGDLVPALDIEKAPETAAAKQAFVGKCRSWIDQVSQAIGGKKPFIYTTKAIWAALGNPSGFSDCPLWIARYGPPPSLPPGWSNYTIWQFSEQGQINGITGNVDENTLGVTFQQLKANCTI